MKKKIKILSMVCAIAVAFGMCGGIWSFQYGGSQVKASSIPKNIVNQNDKKYNYRDMATDLKQISSKYPNRAKLVSLGKTADKRNIYCIIIGNPNASKQIIVNASMHAREYLNTKVAMTMVEKAVKSNNPVYQKVAIYVIPMVNPDGVTISQYGPNKIRDTKLRKRVKQIKRVGSYRNWKANGRGVDLNRNFSSGHVNGEGYRSENRGGNKANSEAETKALVKVIKSCSNLKACINLHCMGKLIYWGYTGKRESSEKKLLSMVKGQTHYSTEKETGKGYGDFEHYLKNTAKVPYVCIENGIGGVPVSNSQYKGIYNKNKNLIYKAANLFK